MEAMVNQGSGRSGKVNTSGKVKNSCIVNLPNSEVVGIVNRYERPVDEFIIERVASWGIALENVKRYVYTIDETKTSAKQERKASVDMSGSITAIVSGFDAMIDKARNAYKANEISGREFGVIKARIERSKKNAIDKINSEIHVSNSELPNSESIGVEVSARFEKSMLLAAYRKQVEFLTKVYTKTVKTEREYLSDKLRTIVSNLNRAERRYVLCKTGKFRNVEKMNSLERAIDRYTSEYAYIENHYFEFEYDEFGNVTAKHWRVPADEVHYTKKDWQAQKFIKAGTIKKVYTYDNGKFTVKNYTNWPDAIASIKRIARSKVSAFAKIMADDMDKAREIIASGTI